MSQNYQGTNEGGSYGGRGGGGYQKRGRGGSRGDFQGNRSRGGNNQYYQQRDNAPGGGANQGQHFAKRNNNNQGNYYAPKNQAYQQNEVEEVKTQGMNSQMLQGQFGNSQQVSNELTAEQKFQMMLSGQLHAEGSTSQEAFNSASYQDDALVQDDPSIVTTTSNVESQSSVQKPSTKVSTGGNKKRIRLGKDTLLKKFTRLEEINLIRFDKDVLQWLEMFSSQPQAPEAEQPLETPAEGTSLQSDPRRRVPAASRGGLGGGIGNVGSFNSQRQIQRDPRGGDRKWVQQQYQQEEEEEEDPEWADFDPEKESSTFIGRTIVNEEEMRENIKRDKERQKKLYGDHKTVKQIQEEEFEKLVQEKQEERDRIKKEQQVEAEKLKQVQIDQELARQVEEMVKDFEEGQRNYSDIDLIYEKNAAKQRQQREQQIAEDQVIDTATGQSIQGVAGKTQAELSEEELTDLFSQLIQVEEEKKLKQQQDEQREREKQELLRQQQIEAAQRAQQIQQQQQQQQQQQPPVVDVPQYLKDQLKQMTDQLKEKVAAQTIHIQPRPKFTALQNVQNLFSFLPMVAHERHRIKMQEIEQMDIGQEIQKEQERVKSARKNSNVENMDDQVGSEAESKSFLFKQMMSSINPFSKYIIEESFNPQQGSSLVKHWQIEESIFQKPPGQHPRPENLHKTSSEMFAIYKYFSDPLLKVKSEKYTEGEFRQFKEIFPVNNLLEVSPLTIHLTQNALAQQLMSSGLSTGMNLNTTANAFVPQRKLSSQPNESQQSGERQLEKATIGITSSSDQLESLEENKEEEEEEQVSHTGRDLDSMENQLKSLLGFNPK